MPQPRPLRISPLRQVAIQPGGQLTDEHRIAMVGLVEGVVVAFPRPVHRQRLHTHEPHASPVGQPHQRLPPMPGRLARHRHPHEPVFGGMLPSPHQQRSQIVRLHQRDLAGQRHVVVVHQCRDLLVLTQINREHRTVTTNHLPQRRDLLIATPVPPRQPGTVGHERPPRESGIRSPSTSPGGRSLSTRKTYGYLLRDGGYGYAATDLAAIRYRTQEVHATRLLYVVGLPQRQHLEMVYEAAREAGWLTPPARAQHVGFGSVLGPDGKILRSRAGDTIKLAELVDEAVSRAAALVAEKNPELDEDTRADVARMVGIGAIKYADLSNDRVKDYVFDWDRMLSFDGNTAPYLQYAHARIRSIFRRAEVDPPGAGARVLLTEPAERDLALQLLGFDGAVQSTA